MIADKDNAKKKFGVKASDIKNGVELGVLAGNVKLTSDGLKKEQKLSTTDGGNASKTEQQLQEIMELQADAAGAVHFYGVGEIV